MSMLKPFLDLIGRVNRAQSSGVTPEGRQSLAQEWEGFVSEVALLPDSEIETFEALGSVFINRVSGNRAFRFFSASRPFGTEPLEGPLERLLLERGAWPHLRRSSSGFQASVTLLRLANALRDSNTGSACWLLNQTSLNEVQAYFKNGSHGLRMADGSFCDGRSELASWFRLAPLPVVEALVEKGIRLTQDDGRGWPLAVHLQGFFPGFERTAWALEKGFDPLAYAPSHQRRHANAVGFIRGLGNDHQEGSPAYERVTSYIKQGLSGWPLEEVWGLLENDQIKPASKAHLKRLVLEDRFVPVASPTSRGPRL